MKKSTKTIVHDEELQIEACHFQGITQSFPNHFHEYHVIGCIEQGQRRLSCRNRDYTVGKGVILLFSPGDSHACTQRQGGALDYRSFHIPKKTMHHFIQKITGTTFSPHFSANVLYDRKIFRSFLTLHENIMKKGGASVPATWDDVLSMTDFKDKTGTYPYALACTGVRAPQEMIVYLAQKGLEICSLQDDGMYKNTWKDNADQLAAAADVFQFYKDCIDSGVVDPNSKSFGYEETDDNFVNGFSASYVTGNWLQEKEDANPEVMSDVTVEPIPVPEGGTPATYMELKPLFLFNTSKNNDAAFDFATYVCGKEWQQDVYSSASPRSDVTVPGKWTEDFQALSDNGVAFPPVTLGSISQAMIDSIAKVLQEGMTPQAAAEWLADAVNTSLEESGELSAS